MYLAVVLDAYRRRGIGWCRGRHLAAALTLAARRLARERRAVAPGLLHHAERGVQEAAHAYPQLLTAHGMRIRMSRHGNPYDNARAERCIKTLQDEEVDVNDDETLEEARASSGLFLQAVYNGKRLHSALGYRPPAEYEAIMIQSSPP
jgi:putative transposase